jgi:predicted helicase
MSIQLIQQYHAQVEKLIRYGGSRNESALRKPFQDLLEAYAQGKNLLLVPEVEVRTRGGKRVVPDGTLKDALRQDWGYWESKDEKDDLQAEIAVKFAKGYPSTNILFEDTHNAVLYQNAAEVARASFTDASALDALLSRFVAYEPPEVTEFHRAIEQFNADVPALAAELRAIIQEQADANAQFRAALGEFLELCQKAINPNVEMADAREMLIQHILTEDIFMTIFDDPQFHRENAIARELQEVIETFYHGAARHKIHGRIAPFYEAINARASQIYNHHEKQKFLKALYENFYRAYNPKAADRLGVIYTPDEIVRFMLQAADHLAFKHFGKTLGDENVEILDPATGTGTFITELIECLPEAQLPRKYRSEIHCNEVAILPYYIANLNIEYAYRQKMGEYAPFENICFVDTLDNMGFAKSGQHQMDFLGLVDENTERIERQNERKISVIIGNPPYNANQLNENENNKNREYPDIDRRIKDTYIKHSTAQKTKVYDMYARFLRWAGDRLDRNGVIAFVSNNSFLDARTYDGFRKVVADEFNHIYVIDLKGNARTSGERRRREGGNVFSDQIRVGVAVYFLVRKQGEKGCRIHYNAVPDYAHAEEKKAYLRDNPFADLKFEAIRPDKNHNWLNLVESDWDELIPVASKEAKEAKPAGQAQAIFKFHSLGVSTNRDEWVLDLDEKNLKRKAQFLVGEYNRQVAELRGADLKDIDARADYSIKWSETLKRTLAQGTKLEFDSGLIVNFQYRPFFNVLYYSEKALSDRLTANHFDIFGPDLKGENTIIAVNVSNRLFNILASNHLVDLHFNGDSQCLPLYRYTAQGERVDNITDWALAQFREHYGDKRISKENIFHYVYAVLHLPAYREKYALNLKREFPRIPFYEDFRQWVKWGKALMNLHLNYESAKLYRLKREERKGVQLNAPTPTPRLIARKESGVIEIDAATTLRGVPPEAWQYQLGTYSALEWVLERYKERDPRDPTLREKFNTYRLADYKEHVIDLLRRVCTVSVETVKIVGQMPG